MQNCLVASCGRGLALVVTQGGPLQCGILHLCTSDFSQHHLYCSLGSRVVILAFWSSLLLWDIFVHLVSYAFRTFGVFSYSSYQRQNCFLS